MTHNDKDKELNTQNEDRKVESEVETTPVRSDDVSQTTPNSKEETIKTNPTEFDNKNINENKEK